MNQASRMKIKKRAPLRVKIRTTSRKGKPKGAKHSLSHEQYKSVRQSFINVYLALGGDEALRKFANSSNNNKRLFYQLYAKILPKEVVIQGPEENPQMLPFVVEVEKANSDS